MLHKLGLCVFHKSRRVLQIRKVLEAKYLWFSLLKISKNLIIVLMINLNILVISMSYSICFMLLFWVSVKSIFKTIWKKKVLSFEFPSNFAKRRVKGVYLVLSCFLKQIYLFFGAPKPLPLPRYPSSVYPCQTMLLRKRRMMLFSWIFQHNI